MASNNSKFCKGCKTLKSLDEFGVLSRNLCGKMHQCRECIRVKNNVWIEANRKWVNERQRLYKHGNIAQKMYSGAKVRAKKRGREFDIEIADIHVPDFCPILGIRLAVQDGSLAFNSPTLDRIDPAKGYVRGNIMVISHKANTMKNNATIDQLQRFAYWVAETHGYGDAWLTKKKA